MLICYDPDEFETIVRSKACPFHQEHPGKSYAGCTCTNSLENRRRTPEEIAKIKADRRRAYEDSVLREADAIRAGRALKTTPHREGE